MLKTRRFQSLLTRLLTVFKSNTNEKSNCQQAQQTFSI
nr:MAG TPA: hypothetical protein [Caudoviricetes sp.]